MHPEQLKDLVIAALEDMKAVNIKVFDVRGITSIADFMVIATGTADRHVKSVADNVVTRAKQAGQRPLGVEGEREGEWILVDLGDVVAHVMLPRIRDFYQLEKLWDVGEGIQASPGKWRDESNTLARPG
mgnify:CR=1 FL=1